MIESNSTTQICGICGGPITAEGFMSAGTAYHFNGDCQVSSEPEPIPPKTLTEEDVRRIVREEMAAMWRSQTTGALTFANIETSGHELK